MINNKRTEHLRLNRGTARLSMMHSVVDDDYVDAPIGTRIAMVWDITVQLWSIAKKGDMHAESRLQRHVARLRDM
jgi:predicted DNA-binding protein with PD1-like motif